MLGIIEQPKDYSAILRRVFVSSTFTGIVCTSVLATLSPDVRAFTDLIKGDVNAGPLHLPNVLTLLVPLALALFSRIVKLHDRISDIFRIRAIFDVRAILVPMARRTVGDVDENKLKRIKRGRRDLMRRAFYKYASSTEPRIDAHLVRSALDQWGWVWVFAEASAITLVAAIIAWMTIGWCVTWAFGITAIVLLLFSFLFLPSCVRHAREEIDAVLEDSDRSKAIGDTFNAL